MELDGKTSSPVYSEDNTSAEETGSEKTARRSRVSGIDRALQVIDYLYETGSPAGVYAIAKAVKAPLSTVYVIVDDLVDTGATARYVREMLPGAHFATVYAKPKGREMVDTFITEVSQDTWIFFPWDLDVTYVAPISGATD